MKNAIITGTTSGFGRAFALRLASLGYNVAITGRREERLEALAQEIRSMFENVEVLTYCYDVRSLDECRKAVENISARWSHIDLLVNNAGLAAGATTVDKYDIEDWERMIDTNVKGLLYMTRLISPLMVAQGSGHIVNISSIAGHEVYPNGNVYCGTKHAVAAITKGTRIDLVDHNIRVSSISPGAAETEFSIVRFHGDQEKADAVYQGLVALSAEDIADTLEFIVTRPAHVNICDILLTPTRQANTWKYNRS